MAKQIELKQPDKNTLEFIDEGRKYRVKGDKGTFLVEREDEAAATEEDAFWGSKPGETKSGDGE